MKTDVLPAEHRSRLSVSIKPKTAIQPDRPLLIAVFSFRDDAHLVRDLVQNIEPFVDGWIAYDDRQNEDPFGDETERRKALLQAAAINGAKWVLAIDVAERIESAAAEHIRELTREDGLVAYEFRLRAMYSPTEYRVDGGWSTVGARRLFSIQSNFAYERSGFTDHWYPSGGYRIIRKNLNIYDFRMASAERRQLKRDIGRHLDPLIEHRPFAHEHLTDEGGIMLRPIQPHQSYSPVFRDDGETWSAAPPSRQELLTEARDQFRRSAYQLFNHRQSPVFGRTLPGHMRGMDRLDRQQVTKVLTTTINRFTSFHGYRPDLFEPKRYLEKVVWRKFFSNLRVPQSGNKLLVKSYIPVHLSHKVSVPSVVWQSAVARLPDNSEVAAGAYYLKSNHGSGNVEKIIYPLEQQDRVRLENMAAQWLQKPFRPENFEWWYNVFPRLIFLEQSVGDEEASTTWSYPAFAENGIPYVNVNRKTETGVQAVRLSRDLEPLPEKYQPRDYERLTDWKAPLDPALIEQIASAIAEPLGFARVDFLFGADGACYLNEVTLTPNNAEAYVHPELDMKLGEMWTRLV